MYNPIVWVARTDSSGWDGTRPRDMSDYAMSIDKETDTRYARLTVRQTYTNDPKARARQVVAEFYFEDSKEAKLAVTSVLDMVDSARFTDQLDARERFMLIMNSTSKAGSAKPHGSSSGASGWYKDPRSSVVMTVGASKPVTATEPRHIGELAEEVMDNAIANAIANSGQWVPYKPVPTGYVSPEILEAIAEVQEVVEPVFNPDDWKPGDPVPQGYFPSGNKLVKLGWPS